MEVQEIKDMVEASGLKVGDLEKSMGVAQSTLSKFLRGERKLAAEKVFILQKLCAAAIKKVEKVAPSENDNEVLRIISLGSRIISLCDKKDIGPEAYLDTLESDTPAETFFKRPNNSLFNLL